MGRVYEHPKAAIDKPGYVQGSGSATRFVRTVFIAAFSGLVGALIGSIWGFGFPGFIGGSMFGFAARTAWLLFAGEPAPDEYTEGKSRTEEEVRQALDDIRSRNNEQ